MKVRIDENQSCATATFVLWDYVDGLNAANFQG